MRRTFIRRAALAVPALAVGLTASIASAQGTSATGWRTVAIVPDPNNATSLISVAVGDPDHAWAVGATSGAGNPVALEAWNGSAWSPVTLPPAVLSTLGAGAILGGVSAAGSSDVWAFSFHFFGPTRVRWLHFDGTKWTAGKLPSQAFVNASLTIGTRLVWAFGWTASARSGLVPYAAYHTSTGWQRTPVPGHGGIADASAVTGRDIWAVTGASPLLGRVGRTGGLLHWYAGHWHTVPTLPAVLRNAWLSSVLARGDRNVWVGGEIKNSRKGTTEAVGHWNGRRWTVLTLDAAATSAKWRLMKMVSDGSGGIWAVGGCMGDKCGSGGAGSRLWHEVAGKWGRPVQPKLAKSPTILVGLAATGRSVWGVGADEVSSYGSKGLIALWGPTP
jgi:hypothetical protein